MSNSENGANISDNESENVTEEEYLIGQFASIMWLDREINTHKSLLIERYVKSKIRDDELDQLFMTITSMLEKLLKKYEDKDETQESSSSHMINGVLHWSLDEPKDN